MSIVWCDRMRPQNHSIWLNGRHQAPAENLTHVDDDKRSAHPHISGQQFTESVVAFIEIGESHRREHLMQFIKTDPDATANALKLKRIFYHSISVCCAIRKRRDKWKTKKRGNENYENNEINIACGRRNGRYRLCLKVCCAVSMCTYQQNPNWILNTSREREWERAGWHRQIRPYEWGCFGYKLPDLFAQTTISLALCSLDNKNKIQFFRIFCFVSRFAIIAEIFFLVQCALCTSISS